MFLRIFAIICLYPALLILPGVSFVKIVQVVSVPGAIELKFKTEQQGAQDHGRIDAYVDIEAVELVTKSQFTFVRFYMITDSKMPS